MGTILNSRIMPDNKIKITLALRGKEALASQGRIKGMHLFCEELVMAKVVVVQEEDELYFPIPFSNVPQQFKKISCQRIEDDKKDFLIYTCHK